MDIYDGEARLADGSVIRVSGTIQQMACWADNLIRSSGQNSDIRIRRRQEQTRQDDGRIYSYVVD